MQLTNELKQEIIQRYLNRERSGCIAKDIGCSTAVIRKIVRKAGYEINPKGNQYRDFSQEEILEMIRFWNEGKSQTYIAKTFNSSQNTISRVLRNNGIQTSARLMKKENHVFWKGGRIITSGGYIRILISADNQFAQMRDRMGYVLEHRLNMSKHLNRILSNSETVHHINGDITDNRIENLQLRQGKHGKGVTSRCLDCGSHNIIAIKLAEQSSTAD